MKALRIRDDVGASSVGRDVWEFLEMLGGPTVFRIPGRDRGRCRAVVTLLHGNEPSGVQAIRSLLLREEAPRVDVLCFVASVQAALAPPGFAHRVLPGYRDLNRCFRFPFEGHEGEVASEFLEAARSARPEALVDLHNTSGSGPPYGVTTKIDAQRLAITSRFADRVILTDLRLGALMEAVEDDFPTVTIECGGSGDPRSDRVAADGLCRFVDDENVLEPGPGAPDVAVLEHPVRLEIRDGARVAYANEPVSGVDVTLRHDVDELAFRVVEAGELLAWTDESGFEALVARRTDGRDVARDYFALEDGRLVPRRRLRLFMVTTNPGIAISDCLFYFLETEETTGPRPAGPV